MSDEDCFFAPTPWDYAVVRMDPVAMVQHLDDAQALEAAARIQPTIYLVHLSWDSVFPFPGKPWYGFSASLVGPSLRAVDEERCISSDMCIPIFPNTAHPGGREPVRPKPERPFPFDNCYHWSFTDMKIRVIASPEGFNTRIAVKLDAYEDTRREEFFATDGYLQAEALKARDGPSPSVEDVEAAPTSSDETEDEQASIRSYSTFESSVRSAESIDTMTEMGFFGDPSGNIEFQPLVHLWLDIEARLKQEDIVSPVHFYEEIDAITQIIRDARARNPSLPPLREPLPCGLEDENEETHDAGHHEEDTGGESSDRASSSKRGRLRPRKLLRKLCAKLQRAFRLPSVLWGFSHATQPC